ncbi:MAG: response regulator [Chloroflexi bacterium]|nr:response regulator [Chloroflexota bacterium]
MPDLEARLERLDALFGIELFERIDQLNALFGELSLHWDAAQAGALARSLHGLKGAARAVDASAIEQVVHAAEGATLATSGAERPTTAWFEAMRVALEVLPGLHAGTPVDTERVIAGLAAVSHAPDGEAQPPKAWSAQENPSARASDVPKDQTTMGWTRSTVAQPTSASTDRGEVKPAQQLAPTPVAEQGSVRVSLPKLDALLTESGELSVTRLRISERLAELRALQRQLERWQRDWHKSRPARARMRRLGHRGRESEALLRAAEQADRDVQSLVQRTRELVANLAQNASQLGTVSDAIGQQVMAVRLLPAGTMLAPFERLVRDLSRQIGKEARLELIGADTELDRRILDELRDPLMHMVRNSLDHGLETPAERLQAGKLAQGSLKLAATQRGDRVQITIEDDGRGLDIEAIRATAVRRNLVTPEKAESMDSPALIDLIFHPGFSTRSAVSEISGRGVGMDVVREHVSRLGGAIAVQTTFGKGTKFTISVPLTLATTRVLLVEDGGQTYAVPSSSVERTGRIRASELRKVEGRLAVHIDGEVVPVVELAAVLRRPRTDSLWANDWRPFFILRGDDRPVALLTDQLVDETELVVKGLGAPLKRVRHVSGAAVLGTGAVVVILNAADVSRSSLGSTEAAPRVAGPVVREPEAEAPKKRVLVVDDSVMTRTLERTILESAGYSVVVATDGAHALELLGETPVDAIVSDVEMPRMTGLELTAALRQDERWRHLPVVLVTSLDSPEHVERGAAVGADGYIVKGRFDQNDLLQAIGRLV